MRHTVTVTPIRPASVASPKLATLFTTILRLRDAFCLILLILFGTTAFARNDTGIQPEPSRGTGSRPTDAADIELVRATPQSVTIQLRIAEKDFHIGTQSEGQARALRSPGRAGAEGMDVRLFSFPGCRFTTAPGMPQLPMQSTLIGVPPDVGFEVHVVQSEFKTRRVQTARGFGNRFFPESVAEMRKAGWIRENRVLPIQLNPVQYNPATGEVRLYHRLVVAVQFRGAGGAPAAPQAFQRPESPVYDAMFGNLLINPQTAKQWRAATSGLSGRPRGTGSEERGTVPSAPASTLPTPRYKILVTHDGIHHITGRDLAEATGVDIGTIVPATLKLSNRGRQIPIFVRGEGDSRFDADDEIVFYGQRLRGATTYFHPFSDQNVYWLSWNGTRGLRMATKTPLADAQNAQVYQHFLTRAHFEKDSQFRRFPNANLPEGSDYEEIGAGLQTRNFQLTELPALPSDSWFWKSLPTLRTEKSEPKRAVALPFTLAGVAGTDRFATIRVNFYGRSDTEHRIDLWLNDTLNFEESRWDGETEYQFVDTELLQSYLKNGSNTLRALLPSIEGQLDIVMVNWLEVDYWRTFDAEKDILPFAITPLANENGNVNPHFEVQLNNFSHRDIEIYGVDGSRYVGLNPLVNEETGTYRVVFQGTLVSGVAPAWRGTAHHATVENGNAQDTAIQYIALTRQKFQKPKFFNGEDGLRRDTSQHQQPLSNALQTTENLRGTHNGADYIIITDTPFLPDVQPLAEFRAQQGDLRTKVVNVQNIYDEFNHGILSPYAIRAFLKYAYENWQPPAPTYVLLVGDTHLDLKNEISFVPTIQVQIPGYGATATDHQFVTFRGDDNFPDMLIGRMPARNRVDARVFVERVMNYEIHAETGPWQKRLLMLAGTDWVFHLQTNWLIDRNNLAATYEVKDIFAPTNEEQTFNERVRSPIARQVIDGFNDGAALVNYIGHGGGGIWASSRMLDLEDPEQNLTNIEQLPFVISMTCFTGFFDGTQSCLAEELLRSQSGGAIAVVGGTSIGLLEGDYALNREIFDVIFEASEDRGQQPVRHVGAILAQAKTQFIINAPGYFDLAEVFTLFGDPATQLRLPHKQIQVTADVGENSVAVSGTLSNRNFSGQAEITVVPTARPSRSELPAAPPEQETVSVVNGRFTADIPLPANSQFDEADVRAYAWNADEDAVGSMSYTALERYVTNIRIAPYPVEPNQPVHFYGEVKNENAINAMTLFWSLDGVNFETIPVVLHSSVDGVSTYRTEQPIPGYPKNELIDYYLAITLQDGRTLQSEIESYEFGEIHVDLSVLEQTLMWHTTPSRGPSPRATDAGDIHLSESPFRLSAKIVNLGTEPVRNVPVQFLQTTATGEPEETVLLEEELQNATPIGEVQILTEVLPGSEVVASVPWQPPPGNYLVTVVVDMPSEAQPKGTIIERRERNNTAARHFSSNWVLLTPEQRDIVSGDGMLRLSLPPGSIQTPTLMTFERKALTITNQPDIIPVAGDDAAAAPAAYELGLDTQTGFTATAAFRLSETSRGTGATDAASIYMLDAYSGNWIRVGNETNSEETLSTQVKLPGTFALLSHADSRPPALDLTVENQGFIDGDYISDTPTISARIEDANGVDTRPENIVLTKNGERVPQDEYIIAASPVNTNVLLITYTPILEAGEYAIRLQAQDANGNPASTGRTATVAGEFEIKNIANFPNPFTPGRGTDFAYYLTESADEVSLKIYTVTGRLITVIDTLDAAISYNEFHYDGLDADGEPLANGVYLYKFTAHQGETRRNKVGKLVVIK